MQNSRIAGVIAAGCGFLLLVNTALILLILYIVVASQSPAGRQSLESLFASLARIISLEQDTSLPVEATVAALATDVHKLVLRPDSSSSVQVEDARPTPTVTASATPWPTVTTRPTNTPRPSPTTRPSPTPVPTVAPGPTSTARPTSTPRPTATTASPAVSDAPEADESSQATNRYYVTAPYRANARSCPRTSCPVITSLALGTGVDVLQRVDGESIGGSTTWLELKEDGRTVFVHGSLLSQDRPQPAAAPVARPVSQPQQQAQQAQPAAPGEPIARPAADTRPAYTGLSCTAIREQHGDGNFGRDHPAYTANRDRDDDGIACEL